MAWTLEFDPAAVKQLAKLDKPVRQRLIGFLEDRINDNPRTLGKALTGGLSGYWRYRVGDYRMVCELLDGRMVVLVLKVGHRSIVYE